MKTKFITFIGACLLSISLSYAQGSYTFSELRGLISGASGTLSISESKTLEGIVISDAGNPNMETNPRLAFGTPVANHFAFDWTENDKTAYIQALDGSFGLRLKFTSATSLAKYSHVSINLTGLTLTKEDAPERYTLSDLTAASIASTAAGTAADVVEKEKAISELTDADVYTFVKLKNTEMALPYGAYANIRTGYVTNTSWSTNGIVNAGYYDAIPSLVRDNAGSSMYLLTNIKAPWSRNAVSAGNGYINGIIVHSQVPYYAAGDLLGKYQIRVLGADAISMSQQSNTQTIVEWNWFQNGTNPCTAATIAKDGIYALPVTGNGKLYCSKTDASSNLATYPMCQSSPTSSTDVNTAFQYTGVDWWNSGDPNAFIFRFSTTGVTGSNFSLNFSQGGGSGEFAASQIPIYWEVQYTTDGDNYVTLPNSTYSIRPLSKWQANMPYAYQSLQDHTFSLPDSLLDKADVWVKLIPKTNETYSSTGQEGATIGSTGQSIRIGVVSFKYTAPYVEPDFASGTGASNDPYIIMNAVQLNNVRKYLDQSFKLGADIDLTEFLSNKANGWEPFVGFTGDFDGDGKTISSLWITNGGGSTALFNILAAPAKIHDLTVKTSATGVKGSGRVGILVGSNNTAEIYNCKVSGFVAGTTSGQYNFGGFAGYNNGYIHDCNVDSIIVNGYLQSGGMLGINDTIGRVENCTITNSTVTNTANYAGGLASHNNGSIKNCNVYTVSVTSNSAGVGGLLAYNKGLIQNCKVLKATITGTGANTTNYFGGLVGNFNMGSLDGCTVDSTTITTTGVVAGGLVGIVAAGNVTDCHVDHLTVQGYTSVGGLIGQNSSTGLIESCSAIATVITTGFSGSTGGNQVGGLIGINGTALGGTIRNCWAKTTITGNYMVGGLIGRNYKNIENCWAYTQLSAAYNGGASTGGFIGRQDNGKVVNSFALATSKARSGIGGFIGNYASNAGRIDSCYSIGSVFWYGAGDGIAGGFIGDQAGGVVNASYCQDVLLKMAGGGNNYVGMFNGKLNSDVIPSISGSYYLTDFAGVSTNGTIVNGKNGTVETTGLSGADAYDKSKYTTFNFDNNTWQIWEGKSAPYFSYQSVPLNITSASSTGIVAESKENIAVGTTFQLRKDSVEINITKGVSGKNLTATFSEGSIANGDILFLIVQEEGKAPAASAIKYVLNTDIAQQTIGESIVTYAAGKIRISTNDVISKVLVVDQTGSTRFAGNYAQNDVNINATGWSQGVYIVKVITTSGLLTAKVLVK